MNKATRIDKAEFQNLSLLLEKQGRLELRVITGSMAPLIHPGDLITVEPLRQAAKRNDIIVFRHKDALVCHLIIHVNKLSLGANEVTYSTCGLNNVYEDFPCSPDLVFGRVTSHQLSVLQKLRLALRRLRNH